MGEIFLQSEKTRRTTIYQFYLSLLEKYGKPEEFWRKWRKEKKTRQDREKIVLGAILTQRTNWKNVEMALNNLKNAKVISFKDIYCLGKKRLTLLIKPSGFYKQKAERIHRFCKFIVKNYETLEKFFKQDLATCREELLKLSGIGPETADSILLYAGQKPIFVIDEYTRRFVKKHKISNNLSYNYLQDLFQKNLPKNIKIYQDFHALIVLEGKQKIPKMRNEKKILELEKIREEVKNIADRTGKPIDKNIRETVVMFEANGLSTSSSCEGHIEKGLVVPYMEVSTPNEPEERFINQNKIFEKVAKKYNITPEQVKTSKINEAYWEAMKECSRNEETEEYKNWKEKNKKLMQKAAKLLEEFYKERQVELNIKLQIDETADSFRIHNGGEDYNPIIETEQKFSEKEKKIRSEKLKKYRAEMEVFTKFLKDRYFERPN